MANKNYSLAHTKWMCKYHIVFTPKYRRKAIYAQYRRDLQEYIRRLCKYKGVEIIEEHMVPDHVRFLLSIPPIEEAVQLIFKLQKQRNAEIIVLNRFKNGLRSRAGGNSSR